MRLFSNAATLLSCALSLAFVCATARAEDGPVKDAPTLQPRPERNYVAGPEVTDEDVATWLASRDAERGSARPAPRAWLKLPVTITFSVEGLRSIDVVVLAGRGEASAVRLRLDDGGLGIGLSTRLRTLCPDGPTCTIWVAGHWGALVGGLLDIEAQADAVKVFSVLDVGGVVGPDDEPLRVFEAR